MKDGRIVGFGKSASGFAPDASTLDVASAVPVRVVGFTKDEVDQIMADDPVNEALFTFAEVPAGTIFDNTEPFYTSVVISNLFTHPDAMNEDAQYRFTKAAWSILEEAAQQVNYQGAMDRVAAETTDLANVLPIFPGAQRYYDEVG